MGECPYGLAVGDPPSINNCPDGFRDCCCMLQLYAYGFGIPDDDTMTVIHYWQRHPNGFCDVTLSRTVIHEGKP